MFVLSFLLVISQMSKAQDDRSSPSWVNEMMDNVSMDYVTCAAYYAHTASAVLNAEDQDTSDGFANLYENVITLAFAAAKASRSEEMALKVTMARLNIVMDDMQDEIENNYSNLSLLYEKHHKRCDFIINNTEAFLEEWEDKSRPE